MATVYDYARILAKAMQQSDEHRQVRRLGARLSSNERLESLLMQFRVCQLEIQAGQLQGHPPSKEETEELERLQRKVEGEPILQEYLAAETEYGRMLIEVQQILSESFIPDLPGGLKQLSLRMS